MVYSIRCNHLAWSNTTGKHFLLATWCNSVLLLVLYFRNNYFSFKGRQIMARRLKRLLLILTLFLKWFINQQLNQDRKRYFEENLQNIWYWKEVGSRREREREHLIVSWGWGSTLSLLHFSLNYRNGQLHAILVGLKGGDRDELIVEVCCKVPYIRLIKFFVSNSERPKKKHQSVIYYI